MDAFIFKFSKDGETRRTSFPVQPSWAALSNKISHLFQIPLDAVAVSYIDADQDEITLSSEAELSEYYLTNFKRGQICKLYVQDLRDRSETRTSIPRTLHTATGMNRDTFGNEADLDFDVDGEWQVPQMGSMFIPTADFNSPHGFVETVPSDTSSVSAQEEMHDARSIASDSTMMKSAMSAFPSQRLDKGKGRAQSVASVASLRNPSTISLLAGSVNVKPDRRNSTSSASTLSGQDAPSVVSEEATPRFTPSEVPESVKAANAAEAGEAVPDPPLPPTGEEAATQPLPTLYNDIATLLTNFTSIVGAHPELVEGFRNILHNASNGSYWAAHREAIHRAADEISQQAGNTAADLQSAEAEATRRVAESMGNVFRAFAGYTGTMPTNTDAGDSTARNSAAFPWTELSGFFGPPSQSPSDQRGTFQMPYFDGHPPPPPPPPGAGGSGFPPAPFGYPPRGPPPFHRPPQPPLGPTPPHIGMASVPPPPPLRRAWPQGANVGWNPPPPPSAPPAAKPTPQQLRANVEAAKLLYKTEKQRYRQGREELRREKERARAQRAQTNPVPQAAPPPAPPPVQHPELRGLPRRTNTNTTAPGQIVSNARGQYPQLEMVSVPRRHNTHLGHARNPTMESQGPSLSDDPRSRSLRRINRKLADMGFTQSAHPEIPSKADAQLPNNGTSITKEMEDNVVTTVLEELIIKSPTPAGPIASGSGSK